MRSMMFCWMIVLVAHAWSGELQREATQRGERDMLAINEDNSHFFSSRSATDMTRAGLNAFVDQYASSSVTHLFLCPNAMRASFRSRTRDAIWDAVGGVEPHDRWPQNARLLHASGLDPYAVWIDRCREKGISPWLSMRMNDVHSVDEPGHFMHSSFWREHPELWCVPNGTASPWQNRAMNYAHEAVRAHQMAFVDELLERYDVDGIELDWMRFGYHLTPGKERDEADILTRFVSAVRERVDVRSRERGHPLQLSVRVPSHPDAAAGLGLDAVLWARERWVDMVVPCPFWSSSDFDIPVELWKQRLGSAIETVRVIPGVEHNARPWPSGAAVANTLESLYGFAASARFRGADGLYLFNWMDSQTRPVVAADYRHLISTGLSNAVVLGRGRRHPVCYRDTVPPGVSSDVCLPVEALTGGVFPIHIGPKPGEGKAWVVIGLGPRDLVKEARLNARVNGVALDGFGETIDLNGIGGGAVRAVSFACPVAHLVDGVNQVDIAQSAGAAQQIVWVEMRIDRASD